MDHPMSTKGQATPTTILSPPGQLIDAELTQFEPSWTTLHSSISGH